MTLKMPIDPHRDHIRGAPRPTIMLVEYGDFECPFCGRAYPMMEALLKRYPDELALVYRHLPMAEIHPHAVQAAEAAEAAHAQNRFWEMYEVLFENQGALDTDSLIGYAGDLELDLDQFTAELEQHRHLPHIKEDFLGGVRSGVNGTPTLFVNGRRYDGALELRPLSAMIDELTGTHVVPR